MGLESVLHGYGGIGVVGVEGAVVEMGGEFEFRSLWEKLCIGFPFVDLLPVEAVVGDGEHVFGGAIGVACDKGHVFSTKVHMAEQRAADYVFAKC